MTTSKHPSAEALKAFVTGGGASAEIEHAEVHLRSGCIRCLQRTHRVVVEARQRSDTRKGLQFGGKGKDGQRYVDLEVIRRQTVSIDRQAMLIEVERTLAPELMGDLLLMPESERRSAVREEGRFRFYGVTELLIAESRSECFRDVARAIELGRLAVDSADALRSDCYPPGLVVDALALGWGALGNAHRVRGDLVDAERALQTAWELLQRGSGDRVSRADVLSLLGSLRTDQARFNEAVEALAEAVTIHREEFDTAMEAKCLLKLANAWGETGAFDRAVGLTAEARSLLKADKDEWLFLLCSQTLSAWLREAGRVAEARSVFDEFEGRYREKIKDPASLLRLEWLGALLARSEGRSTQAEDELRRVRDGFGDRGSTYDVCMVSLDLASLYLEEGRTADVRELARELVPIFASRQIHHYALAAMNLFQCAAEADRVTLDFVRELTRYLHHSRRNPYLKFQPAQA